MWTFPSTDKRVAQHAQQVADVIVVAQESRLGEHASEGLLDQVLGLLA
jgi:hypothetical protein